MSTLAWLLAGLIAVLNPTFVLPSSTPGPDLAHIGVHQVQPPAALPGFKQVFAGTPKQIGLKGGTLSPCPDSPNCVVSQTADPDHAIAPIAYQTDRETAYATLLDILSVVPRTEIIEQDDSYIRAESSSRLMGFVDDVEFYLPSEQNVIHMRSASRLGESDLGVNRRRLEQIRLAAQDLGL
ncbi:MAG: DUF1499 domain-containing protein [Elainellaceae cyanobacterium]